MHETTMDQELEAPLEELEAWGYEVEDDEGPITAATPTQTLTTTLCAAPRGAVLGPLTAYRLGATPTLTITGGSVTE